MQTLKFISASHKLNYLSPSLIDPDSQYRISSNDSVLETDNSSGSSPRQDFDWYSRRSSPMMKSDRELFSSRSEDDDDDDNENDEVLSVGCESPPPPTTQNVVKTKSLGDGHTALKFSIDNILRPEFGEIRKPAKSRCGKRGADDSPVDLSKDCSADSKQAKTEGDGSGGEGNMMWPAWVYCTRYSDRPSSGE